MESREGRKRREGGVLSRSGPAAPLETSAPGMCARSGGIDMVFQPASVIMLETGTRSHSGGIGIVLLPAPRRSVTVPGLGMRSQSGGSGIVSQPASASAVTYATLLPACHAQKLPYLGNSFGCGHSPTAWLQGPKNRGCIAPQTAGTSRRRRTHQKRRQV